MAYLYCNGLLPERSCRRPQSVQGLMIRIAHAPLEEDVRLAGQGTLEQIRSDLEMLRDLGARYILFDTYDDHSGSAANPERDWAALAILAQSVVDLEREELRQVL